MRRLLVSTAAQADLTAIATYTAKHWGAPAKDLYLRELRQGFAALRDNPLLGVARDDLAHGLRAFPLRSHIVFYDVSDETLVILRVLHERMDARRHIGPTDAT